MQRASQGSRGRCAPPASSEAFQKIAATQAPLLGQPLGHKWMTAEPLATGYAEIAHNSFADALMLGAGEASVLM